LLARLLLNKPVFAILDEPTGALDEESVKHVFAALQSLLPATTFVIVAHHRPPGINFKHEVVLGE
jgi:putative ATP-binding cassette transporter